MTPTTLTREEELELLIKEQAEDDARTVVTSWGAVPLESFEEWRPREVGFKWCSMCGERPRAYPNHAYCKPCGAAYARERYHSNPKVREQKKEYERSPGRKAYRREYEQRPEVKAKKAERQREYDKRPERIAANREYKRRWRAKQKELAARGGE